MRRARASPGQGDLFAGASRVAPAPPPFADADDRRLAVTCFDRPVLLVAGAGTGKTGTLTARILTWALGPGWEEARAAQRGEASDEELAVLVLRGIVAITFTEAAAAEMSARVARTLARLARLAREGALDPARLPEGLVPSALPHDARVLHARASALRAALDHLGASTIHAFCRRLLAAHPLEAGLDPDFSVDAGGARIALAVREVFDEALRADLGLEGGEADDLVALARRGRGPDELERDVLDLIDAGARSADFAGPALSESDCARLLESAARRGRELLELAAPLRGVRFNTRYAVEALELMQEVWSEPGPGAEHFDRCCARLRALWDAEARGRLSKWAKNDLIGAEKTALSEPETFAQKSAELAQALVPLLELDREGLEAAHRAAGRLLARVEARLRASGTATFGDLLWGARALLCDHPAIAAEERRRMRQLLVDEFQDTDEVQCRIVAALGLEGAPGERPCLFVVGDPKQSIFAWRNADLAAFDGFSEAISAAGGRRLELSRNFRSVPAVLDEVERAVGPVMERVRGVQPEFVALEAHRAARGGAAVEYWVSWTLDASGAFERPERRKQRSYESEARALAADLLRQHAREGLAWKDAGVIFRALTEIEPYLRELRRRGIPYEVQSDRKYYQRREVVDAGALVRGVLDPTDHLALVALLRSPLVGLPDAALFPLWARGFPGRMTALRGPRPEDVAELEAMLGEVAALLPATLPGLDGIEGWQESARHAVRSIARLRASFHALAADEWVEELRALFLPEAIESARFLGSWRLANLQRFFRELLRTLEERDGDVQSLLRTLRANLARDDKSEATRPADSERDAVKILTIHGAKGLEFRQVYLPQVHKGESDGERAAFDRRGERVSYRIFGLSNPAWHESRLVRDETEAAERVRLLYVALTRARDRLVVMGAFPPERKERTWRQAQNFADLLERHPALAAATGALLETARNGGREPFRDESGAHWVPSAWIEDAPGLAAAPAAAPGAPTLARARAESRALAAARAQARRRSARPRQARPSEEVAHERAERHAERAEASEERDGLAFGRDAAQAAGTAVHRALERLVLAGDEEAALAAARGALAGFVREACDPSEHAAVLARAEELWRRFEAGPLRARLFRLGQHVLARELAVLLPPDGDPDGPVGFTAGAIDLLYREPESGEVVVVDYKTDRVESRDDAEARAEAYRAQAEAYTRAVQQALGLERPPRFELWFLHAGVEIHR